MTTFKDLKFHVSGSPSKETLLTMLSAGGAKKCFYFSKLNIV